MTHSTKPRMQTTYDVLVVGAGTAGLLAAQRILEHAPHAQIVIADAGLALDARRQLSANQMTGYGGAGLYLGGRLYLGPATIPVLPPTSVPPDLHPVLDGAAYAAQAQQVNQLFTALGATTPVRDAPPEPLAEAVAQAATVGLDYVTSYPARLMMADERHLVMRQLHDQLERAGVHFAFGVGVTSIERQPAGFEAILTMTSDDATEHIQVVARTLLLAPGRYGAEWLAQTARHLGAQVQPMPSAFGVRLEVPARAYAALTDVNPDPRMQLLLEQDAVVKTYATCPGGVVVPVARYGSLVASGVPLPLNKRTGNTTLAVLVQPGVRGAAGPWRAGEAAAHLLNERTPGQLVVQRLDDIHARRPTTAAALAANAIRPTCQTALPGMLHDIYPEAYWSAFDELMSRIERLAPGVVSDDVLAYGPAEERFWHFPTDPRLQTNIPGLFVAGDGANHSQGIIQAGVAGALAGTGIVAYLGG